MGRARNPLSVWGTVAPGRTEPRPGAADRCLIGARPSLCDCRRERRLVRRWRWQSSIMQLLAARVPRHAAAFGARPRSPEPAGGSKSWRRSSSRGSARAAQEWDARLETSAIAVLAYLWRLASGQKWAGAHGSAWFACSLAQLVAGLAPNHGLGDIPRMSTTRTSAPACADAVEQQRARFVRQHRKSVQRWLDWLALAGLVEHTPQQDEEGFWWRTVIRAAPAAGAPGRAARGGGRQTARLAGA